MTNKTHPKDLEAILNDEDPYLLTGSPPCEAFSLLQGLNKNKIPEEVRKQRLEEGREKLRTAVRYYKERRAKGRYFLHEHPVHATAWKEPEVTVVELMEQDDVYVVEGPMCRWGMKSKDASGVGYVRKPTRWMTNSGVLAEILQKECPNKEGRAWHRHVMLVNGRAKAAQVYPPALVAAILKGIKAQMTEDGEIKDLGMLVQFPMRSRIARKNTLKDGSPNRKTKKIESTWTISPECNCLQTKFLKPDKKSCNGFTNRRSARRELWTMGGDWEGTNHFKVD